LEITEEGTSQELKESNRARGIHFLETVEGRLSQGMEIKQPSKGHL